MPEVTVTRSRDYYGAGRRLTIEIDGRAVGTLRTREQLTVTVPAGPHTVGAKMDWIRGAIDLDVDGSDVSVEVSMPMSTMLLTFVRPRSAIVVRRRE